MKKATIIQIIILVIAALGLAYFCFRSYSQQLINNIHSFAPGLEKNPTFFGIKVNNKQIGLEDKEAKIKQALGKPLNEKEEILIPKSATEAGLKRKNIYYQGIEFELLNESITSIVITSPRYQTTKGVKVGDNLAKLKKAYSKLEKRSENLEEDPNNCIYGFYGTGVWTTNFFMKNGQIAKIEIQQEMP